MQTSSPSLTMLSPHRDESQSQVETRTSAFHDMHERDYQSSTSKMTDNRLSLIGMKCSSTSGVQRNGSMSLITQRKETIEQFGHMVVEGGLARWEGPHAKGAA